jgi:hypothetical protein
VSWQEVNSLVRPASSACSRINWSRGEPTPSCFRWRQPRFGTEKFRSGVTIPPRDGRVFQEVSQSDDEAVGPSLKAPTSNPTFASSTRTIMSGPCSAQPAELILQPARTPSFSIMPHDRNIQVDFARPVEDLPYAGDRPVAAPAVCRGSGRLSFLCRTAARSWPRSIPG